ncbi:MAG TPA: chemotaxis protein CheW [Clostridia bacterium]|nr:chemotaxis protein CheW [Clostridia bacterium]
MSEGRRFCTFRLDDLLLGMEVAKVQEVLRHHNVTRVPLAQPSVAGLINLRGQIVTAVNLRRTFALPARPERGSPLNVIVRTESGAISLLVDEIGDVVEVGDEAFEPPPETLSDSERTFITGVYKLEHELLLVLDSEAMRRAA